MELVIKQLNIYIDLIFTVDEEQEIKENIFKNNGLLQSSSTPFKPFASYDNKKEHSDGIINIARSSQSKSIEYISNIYIIYI